ncbi:MAG: hypothetical protein ACJAZ2_001580 [Glaciecola sp.]|jgi:hypothetical protein
MKKLNNYLSVLIAFTILITSINTSAQESLGLSTQKPFPGFVTVAFNQTGAIEIRNIELGYGIDLTGQHSLDVSVGLVSGFFIDTDKTTNTKQGLTGNLGLGHETVLGFGKLLAVNYHRDYGLPFESGVFHSISIKHKQFNSSRHPQDIVYDEYHLSIDEFNATTNALTLGMGYKYKFDECIIRFGMTWEIHHTDYSANGSKYGFQKGSVVQVDNQLKHHDQLLSNTIALKIALHM